MQVFSLTLCFKVNNISTISANNYSRESLFFAKFLIFFSCSILFTIN